MPENYPQNYVIEQGGDGGTSIYVCSTCGSEWIVRVGEFYVQHDCSAMMERDK